MHMTLTLKEECDPPHDMFTHEANTCHTPCRTSIYVSMKSDLWSYIQWKPFTFFFFQACLYFAYTIETNYNWRPNFLFIYMRLIWSTWFVCTLNLHFGNTRFCLKVFLVRALACTCSHCQSRLLAPFPPPLLCGI